MISKVEYELAKDVITKYNEELNFKLVKDRVCCVCKKTVIKSLYKETSDALKQECGMWSDGVVERITFGYGSIHDMESYYIAICDKCIIDLEKNGLATNLKEIVKEVKKL